MYRKHENRAQILHRLNQPGAPSVGVMSEETGVPKATLYSWIASERRSHRHHAQHQEGSPGMEKRKKHRSPSNKLRYVAESITLEGEALLSYCQSNGIMVEELLSWRDLALSGIESAVRGGLAMTQEEQEEQIKFLQKEIRRKNDALAEAAALLVLQKKTSDILGIKS
jgi:transposase